MRRASVRTSYELGNHLYKARDILHGPTNQDEYRIDCIVVLAGILGMPIPQEDR